MEVSRSNLSRSTLYRGRCDKVVTDKYKWQWEQTDRWEEGETVNDVK
jgi:hypothetical protein